MKKIKISYCLGNNVFGFKYLYTDNKTFVNRVYDLSETGTFSESFSMGKNFLSPANELIPTTYNSLRKQFGRLPKLITTAPLTEGWVK
jgi:hypothetical protein